MIAYFDDKRFLNLKVSDKTSTKGTELTGTVLFILAMA